MSRQRRRILTPAEAMRLSRRGFLRSSLAMGGLALGPSLLTACGDEEAARDPDRTPPPGSGNGENPTASGNGESTAPESRYWHVAIMADSHCIDEFYTGPESNELDTQSILHANERFVSARDFINSLVPRMEAVFHLGDLIHTYPSTDEAFYVQNRTSLDIARETIDGFQMPFRFLMGNHDYFVPRASREFTHELFAEKFENYRTYHSVDLHGWKFVSLNNYLGASWDASDGSYEKDNGTFGEEQLQWLEAELEQGMPTFVFIHHPAGMVDEREFGDFSFHSLMRLYQDNVAVVMSGHWHRWFELRISRGPTNWLIGSTRYDEDAFAIVEFDRQTGAFRFVNQGGWRMHSWETNRWDPVLDDDGRFT